VFGICGAMSHFKSKTAGRFREPVQLGTSELLAHWLPFRFSVSERENSCRMRVVQSDYLTKATRLTKLLLAFLIMLCLKCDHVSTRPSRRDRSNTAVAADRVEAGLASYYGRKYQDKPTASGEAFDVNEMTAAHRTYAFGTIVRVTRRDNHCSVEVRINDRGPFVSGRIIDLSLAAARQLDMIQTGIAEVTVEPVNAGRLASTAGSCPRPPIPGSIFAQ
jgi:rare lipoprotein A